MTRRLNRDLARDPSGGSILSLGTAQKKAGWKTSRHVDRFVFSDRDRRLCVPAVSFRP
jgi:hypothetical protein